MKVLKMHDNSDEKFDWFVKEQLEKTDVDIALADKYFAQMRWPAAAQSAPKRKRHWILIWLAIGCLVVITVYLCLPTDKKTAGVLPKNNTHPATQPLHSQPTTPATVSDDTKDTATATGPVAKQARVKTKPIENNQINLFLTNDRAAIKQTALSVDSVVYDMARKTEENITIKNTVSTPSAKRDSAVKLLRTAPVPSKAKDSVYIIW